MSTPTEITITGTILDSGGPVAGRLVFASRTLVRDGASNDVLLPQEIVVNVGDSGEFSVDIPATDDPAFSPVGWTWEVRAHFPHWRTAFPVAIPYDSPDGVLSFSNLVPVPPDEDGELYALASHTHEGGGGGGDGPLPSSTVVAETAYGASSSAGNATTYSRGNHTHGTPALPTPAAIGASATGHGHAISDVTNLQSSLDGKSATGHGHAISDVTNLQSSLDGKSATSHNHAGVYDPVGTASSAVSAHTAASDPHPQYSRILLWDGDSYELASDATIYVGPTDPGSVPDGSIWVDTSA